MYVTGQVPHASRNQRPAVNDEARATALPRMRCGARTTGVEPRGRDRTALLELRRTDRTDCGATRPVGSQGSACGRARAAWGSQGWPRAGRSADAATPPRDREASYPDALEARQAIAYGTLRSKSSGERGPPVLTTLSSRFLSLWPSARFLVSLMLSSLGSLERIGQHRFELIRRSRLPRPASAQLNREEKRRTQRERYRIGQETVPPSLGPP